jgi:hypothetical protein
VSTVLSLFSLYGALVARELLRLQPALAAAQGKQAGPVPTPAGSLTTEKTSVAANVSGPIRILFREQEAP